ncbi:hypothetical protein ACWGB8_06000 [Kitasatospora sp. NPDC054939]
MAPLVFAAAAVLVHVDVPQEARFAVGRSAMTSFADQALAEVARGGRLPQPERVGTYQVSKVEAVGTGLRLSVRNSGMFELTGFAYLPDGPPADSRGGVTYTRRSGPWYTWTDNGDF